MPKVYLSPSTQENNQGVGEYKTEEYQMNRVCNIVESILKNYGIKIYRNNPDWDLKRVVEESNKINPDLHVAIHSNAGGGRGCEVFCYKKDGRIGHQLANIIYSQLSKITPTSDRGVKEGFNFYGEGKHMYEVTYTKAPATLIEVNFHDNIKDATWIIDNIQEIGFVIAYAILKQLKISVEQPVVEELYKNYPGLKDLHKKGIITGKKYMSRSKYKYFTAEQVSLIVSRTIKYVLNELKK
jgi:N-acetylmuramoyl-L-alanine amidase